MELLEDDTTEELLGALLGMDELLTTAVLEPKGLLLVGTLVGVGPLEEPPPPPHAVKLNKTSSTNAPRTV